MVVVASAGVCQAAGRFDYRVDLLGIADYIESADAPLAQSEPALASRYRFTAALRPDLRWRSRNWLLLAKPRAEASAIRYRDDAQRELDDEDTDAFIQEAIVRWRAWRKLYLFAGRENLQWGPSYLLSPSNPFNTDNGRNNTSVEVPGRDYAKLSWIGRQFSVAAIANVGAGRNEAETDRNRYALKIDWTGETAYLSLIPFYRPLADASDEYQLGGGFYAGWTVSDAVLLYAEGAWRGERDAWSALGGGSYTLNSGLSIAVEYYHNHGGCDLEPFARCLAEFNVNQAQARSGLVRGNYLFIQVLEQSLFETVDLTFRGIGGLDDGSYQLIGLLDWFVGDATTLFLIGSGFVGDDTDEYGAFADYSVSIGVRHSF